MDSEENGSKSRLGHSENFSLSERRIRERCQERKGLVDQRLEQTRYLIQESQILLLQHRQRSTTESSRHTNDFMQG